MGLPVVAVVAQDAADEPDDADDVGGAPGVRVQRHRVEGAPRAGPVQDRQRLPAAPGQAREDDLRRGVGAAQGRRGRAEQGRVGGQGGPVVDPELAATSRRAPADRLVPDLPHADGALRDAGVLAPERAAGAVAGGRGAGPGGERARRPWRRPGLARPATRPARGLAEDRLHVEARLRRGGHGAVVEAPVVAACGSRLHGGPGEGERDRARAVAADGAQHRPGGEPAVQDGALDGEAEEARRGRRPGPGLRRGSLGGRPQDREEEDEGEDQPGRRGERAEAHPGGTHPDAGYLLGAHRPRVGRRRAELDRRRG